MNIQSDLEFASTFVEQPIPAPAPLVPVAAAPSTSEAMEVDTNVEATESAVVDNNEDTNIKADSIDCAISGLKKEEGYESSDLELSSDSEEDASSDSSDSDDDVAEGDKTCKTQGELLDDDEETTFPDGIVKTAHEIVDIVVEKPTFEMTPQTEIILAGQIFQIIDNVIVIHCRPGSEFSTLDQGSLLVYQNREIMGEVFETFGPVARPYYSVRFNDSKEINAEFGKIGASVFYVPSYQKTQIVETEALKKFKGTDASNVYDEEIGEEEMEFSDDEKEMAFRKKRNKEKKMRKNGGAMPSYDRPPSSGRGGRRPQQSRPRDMPADFDSALEAYEQSMPPRQQQSYADLMDYTTVTPQVTQPPAQQQNYQSPADLVSALFKSYNGRLPTQLPPSVTNSTTNTQQPAQLAQLAQPTEPAARPRASVRSIFATAPPPIDSDDL